jgi:NADH-quinone oxidoreductase subunit L
MPTELLAWLIPLPPLLAFGLIILWAHRSNRISTGIALGAMALSWAMGMLVFLRAVSTEHLGLHPITSSIPWLPLGTGVIEIGVLVDPLSAVTLFFVIWTCLSIFVYSVGYHNLGKARDAHDTPGLPPHAGGVDPLYARFFAFISLFAFGMLTLVLSDNLLLLFIGWEIMGLCSYLLIGFWFGKDSAKQAMVKAFMTTRVGDVFMLLGIAALYVSTGTLNFNAVLHNPEALHHLATTPAFLGLSMAGLIGLLIFAGTVGKSAQFPLHVWLPDAMEGPTPVSAMIHAATMVSAGIYLILRFFPLLTVGWHPGDPLTPTMAVISVIGAFTALFASTIAVAQNDIKRVLAYSTISQLGYMVAAVGVGAFIAAAFHLVTHAFFKALLFLGSGSVIHGMEHGAHETHDHVDPQDMLNMGGLRRRMPWTFWTFLIGGLALSGFPLVTAGFWSKDEILATALGGGQPVVFGVLAVAALLTAFYTARQIGLTFFGPPRSSAAEHAHESSPWMLAPLVVLSIFAVSAGWAGIKGDFPLIGGWIPNWVEEFLSGALTEHAAEIAFTFPPLLTSLVVALGGLTLGFLVYRRLPKGAADPLARWLGPVHRVLQHKYYIDEFYTAVFVRPAYWFGETFTYAWVDRKVIDGILNAIGRGSLRLGAWLRRAVDLPIVNGFGDWVGATTRGAGRTFRVIQTGRVQAYLATGLLFVGLLISFLLLVRP